MAKQYKYVINYLIIKNANLFFTFTRSILPVKYYRDHLAHDIRPDGRGLMEFRPLVIDTGSIATADGSALAKIGDTIVVCGIKAVRVYNCF